MIPRVKEPKCLSEAWGILEGCFFCGKETNMWHWRTNQPVCDLCAKSRKVSELPKCVPNYKPVTKEEYLKL